MRLKKGKKVSLKKEKERSHKMILNALTVENKSIIHGIIILNLNKIEQPK
jgi:hypothetical protein